MPFSSLSESYMATVCSDLSIAGVHPTHLLRWKQRWLSSGLGFPCKKHDLQTWRLLDLGLGLGLGIAFLGRRALCAPRLQPLAALNAAEFRTLQAADRQEKKDEEDEDLCPVECVKEFKTNAELASILETAKESNALVVVDFYRTACGSCKYIEQGFIKLCKGAGDDAAAVVFLKHNVMDDYEEQSEVAERLKIKVVPLFHFYKDGQLLESFPTREKTKILETIQKYLSFPERLQGQ